MRKIRVVYSKEGKVFRFELDEEAIKRNSSGQFILPTDVYSCGYFERVTDGSWDELPWISAEDLAVIMQNAVEPKDPTRDE